MPESEICFVCLGADFINLLTHYRGSTLAEFLNDGDPQGDMVKSVKELQAYDPRGIEVCTTLATRYSKQLFSIYKNKEDPFFSAP